MKAKNGAKALGVVPPSIAGREFVGCSSAHSPIWKARTDFIDLCVQANTPTCSRDDPGFVRSWGL